MAKEINMEALNANIRMLDKRGELAFEAARANGTLDPQKEKFSALISDAEFTAKMLAADSVEEAQALFRENGLEVSEEELNMFAEFIANISKKLVENDGEISEEELEQITGGLLEHFNDGNPGERLFAVLAAFGSGFGGMIAAGKAGFAIGTLCPGFGNAIGATVGAIVGAAGGLVAGLEFGVPVAKGIKKIGSWIKSWF